MKTFLAIVLFSLSGCAFISSRNSAIESDPLLSREPAGTNSYFQAFVAKIASMQGPRHLGRFLGELKSDPRFKAHFANYTLVHESLSLQSATFVSPRALLFGDDAEFVFSFNAETSERGSYAIETVEYDPNSRGIAYREVIFKNDLPQRLKKVAQHGFQKIPDSMLDQEFLLKKSDIEYEDASIVVSKANPQKCLQCHQISQKYQTEARFIWDGYAEWPRVYGADDDTLESETEDPNQFLKHLRDFKRGAKRSSRYGTLDLGRDDEFPYRGAFVYPRRPNLRMTKLFGAYQAESFARLISQELDENSQKTWAKRIFCDGEADEFLRFLGTDFPMSLGAVGIDEFYNDKYFLGSVGLFTHSDTKFNQDFKYMVANVWVLNVLRRDPAIQQLLEKVYTANYSAGQGLSDFKISDERFKRVIASYYLLMDPSDKTLAEVKKVFCK